MRNLPGSPCCMGMILIYLRPAKCPNDDKITLDILFITLKPLYSRFHNLLIASMLPSKLIALNLGTLFVCVCLASASSVTDIDELDLQRQQSRQQLSLAPAKSSSVANDVVAIKEGADLDLSCPIVVKNEDMIISWTCDNEPANIRSSRIHVTDNGKLRIRSSKVGDSCNYRCEVADGHGALSVIIKVIIVDQRLMDELTRRANIAGGNFPPSSLQTVNETNDTPTTTGSETSGAPTKKRIIGKQQRENRSHTVPVEGTPKLPLRTTTKHQELDREIEMQIEPAEISVERNKTFSLECRIKHSPHEQTTIGSPQIIWLKELMGAPPQSINEALEKNLIYLDGVYYHSLNWPRAITYANKSTSASSALLIRQSNYMHSGRYVCFAGYPSTVMNLDHSNAMLSAPAARITNSNDPAATSNMIQNHSPQLRYKIATATVRVDDDEGEAGYLTSLAWGSSQARAAHRQEQLARGGKTTDASDVFMSVVSTNTWQRNLTLLLLIFCGSLMLVKLVMVMRDRARKGQPLQHMAMINDDVEGDSPSTSPPPPLPKHSTDNIRRPAGPIRLASERTGSDPILMCPANVVPSSLDTFRDRFSDAPANSLIAGNNPLRDEYRIDQELLNERLNGIDMGNNNNEHVYSEIDANTHNNNLTIPKSVLSEPYYKLPNKNI
ncbi:hypothetical protein TB1_010176 [Malus domestica]